MPTRKFEESDLNSQEFPAVRKDTPEALAGDGHFVPLLVDSQGRLHVVGAIEGVASGEDVGVVPHGLTKNIDVTPTLSVGGSYVTGDYVGTTGAAMEFALAARANGGTGWVVGALLENDVAESIAMELWLFDAAPTPPTDSAAWSISDADAKKCIGVLKFAATDWVLSALNGVCRSSVVAIPFTCGAASRSLYGCLVARGSLTGAPTVRLNIAQD